jgi:hypothetical protein
MKERIDTLSLNTRAEQKEKGQVGLRNIYTEILGKT